VLKVQSGLPSRSLGASRKATSFILLACDYLSSRHYSFNPTVILRRDINRGNSSCNGYGYIGHIGQSSVCEVHRTTPFINKFLSLREQLTYVRPSDPPTAANPNCPDLRGVNESVVFLKSHVFTLAEGVVSKLYLSLYKDLCTCFRKISFVYGFVYGDNVECEVGKKRKERGIVRRYL
jgi:hypothetical protein